MVFGFCRAESEYDPLYAKIDKKPKMIDNDLYVPGDVGGNNSNLPDPAGY